MPELTDSLRREIEERRAKAEYMVATNAGMYIEDIDTLLGEIDRLNADLAKSRLAEMRKYMESPAMKTFAELEHSNAGTVLAMLQDGAISRGKACETLAQLAHGVAFNDIPLPEEDGRQFGEDEIPADVCAELRAKAAEQAKEIDRLRGLFASVRVADERQREIYRPLSYRHSGTPGRD